MIIVIGKNGQLALELTSLLGSDPHQCLGREDIDITDFDSMDAVLKQYRPAAIINASAYTAVDKAESEYKAAFELNHIAVKNLALYAKLNDIFFVHISTDYVFGGDKVSPYKTADKYHPQSVYGASKAEGEKSILELCPEKSCIIRTSWVYSSHGNNFVKTMLSLMNTKPELGVISDQIGSPTYAKGLAKVCIASLTDKINGIHHYTDTGVASWFDFAVAIQRMGLQLGLLDKKIPIKPITTAQYPTPAKRPHYSVLDKSSLASALPEFRFSHWQEQLHTMMTALKTEQS
jgi:dTDP-4-dehydrorhamnose reductase